MQLRQSFPIPCLTFVMLCGSLNAGVIDPRLASEFRRFPGAIQRVIVTFRDVGVSEPAPGDAREGSSRSSRIRGLMARSRASQQGSLEAMTSHGGMSTHPESFWIANAVALAADEALVHELGARSDVEAVRLDELVRIPQTWKDVPPVPEAAILERRSRPREDAPQYTYGLSMIQVPELRRAHGLTGSGVRLGVLDTGCDPEHPDLAGRVVAWKDLVNHRAQPYDDNGHGTHVCGTIAGGSTSGLAIGVAPEARLLVAKVFDRNGSGPTSSLLAAMQWIADPDGNPETDDQPSIASNSWGGDAASEVFREATRNWVSMGIFPCFAAGNSGPSSSTVGVPAGYPEAFAVGATDEKDEIAQFSSRGPATWDGHPHIKPDVSAPGKAIVSARIGGGYMTLSGTSMATPHVAGVLALLHQANGALTISQSREVLERTAEDRGAPGKDNVFGAGRVNALAAARAVLSGGSVRGIVADGASGTGLVGLVRVRENGVTVRTARGTGRFQLFLSPGQYTLMASAFGYMPSSGVPVDVVAGSGSDVRLVLQRAPTGTLDGRVMSQETGEPLMSRISFPDTPLAPLATDPRGQFSTTLPVGAHRVLVVSLGHDSLTLEGVAIHSGQATHLEARLRHVPPILVVADCGGKGYERYLKESLNSLDKKYTVVDTVESPGLITGPFLRQYQVVLWLTGDTYTDTLTADDQKAVEEFLDGGGGFFLSGQEIGFELKDTGFYGQVLRARFVSDFTPARQVSGHGVTFDIMGGSGANNQRYPDKIEALPGGSEYLTYAGEEGPAAILARRGRGQVLYFPFGCEGIDTAAHRQQVTKLILDQLTPTLARRVLDLGQGELPSAVAGYPDLSAEARIRRVCDEIGELDPAALGRLRSGLRRGPGVPRTILRAMTNRFRVLQAGVSSRPE